MSDTVDTRPDLVEVKLLGFPLEVYRRAREHHDELMREFALLAMAEEAEAPTAAVPRRLVELVEALRSRYARVTAPAEARRDEAIDRGETSVDLIYEVPPRAKEDVLALGRMLDEADDFCRQGEHLLTLATPEEALAFRRWYFGQFEAQLQGGPPTPWDEQAAPVPADGS